MFLNGILGKILRTNIREIAFSTIIETETLLTDSIIASTTITINLPTLSETETLLTPIILRTIYLPTLLETETLLTDSIQSADYVIHTEAGGPGWVVDDILHARLSDYDAAGDKYVVYDIVANVIEGIAEGVYRINIYGTQTDWDAFENYGKEINFIRQGNKTNTTRQDYITLSSDDWTEMAHSPHISIFDGVSAINEIDSIDKLITRTGNLYGCSNLVFNPLNENIKGIYNVGHFYTGAKDESSYLMFNPDTKVTTLKGNVDILNIGDINITSFNDDGSWATQISDAQTDATDALADLTDMADDSVVDPSEKIIVYKFWNEIVAEKLGMDTEADNIGVSRVAYDDDYAALDTYLNTTLGVFSTVNMTEPTNIVRATWDTKWNNYYDEKIKLLNAMAHESASKITLNTSDISGNSSNITINSDNIALSVIDISGNTSNITINSDNIALNVTDISGNASNISQNATDINLRVVKNDVINQINISTEGIVIAGDNIQLNGDTTVDGTFTVSGNIISGGEISGTSIDINSAFTVSSLGALVASDATIENGTITGGTIQTSTTGQRVILADDKITLWDDLGNSSYMYNANDRIIASGNFLAINSIAAGGSILAENSVEADQFIVGGNIGTNGMVLRSNGTTGYVGAWLIAADIPDLPGSIITSGTVADARIASTIARDSELVDTTYSVDGTSPTGGKDGDVHYDPLLSPKMWIKIAGTWRGCE
jgi:hypothetical protein